MKRLAALLLVFAASMPVYADIYTLVEPDGKVRYSNVPNDPRYTLYMREKSGPDGRAGRVRVTIGKQLPGSMLNPALRDRPYHEQVLEAARTHHVDPALIHAVIAAESNYRAAAVSQRGAIGLMQVMPATAARFGHTAAQLRKPEININVGTRYLAWLLERFNGDLQLALAGYNAGENAVSRYGDRIPPYAETRAYVPRVMRYYEQFRGVRYASTRR